MIKPSFYKQTDSRWAKKGYRTTDGGYSTVGAAGCGPTSVANIVNVCVKAVTPWTVFKHACKKGYMTGNSGMYRSAVPKLLKDFGIRIVDTIPRSSEGKVKLKNYLSKNYWAIAIMGKGIWTNGGHYIVAYYVDKDDKVYISDSASSADYRQKNDFNIFWNQQKDVSWLVVEPKPYVKSQKKDKSKTVKTYTLYTNNNQANIRTGRGVSNKLVASLKQNKALKVKAYKSGWWKIASGKYKGKYISGSNLSKYMSRTVVYKANYRMNVRDGYSTSGTKVLMVINQGNKYRSNKQKGRWAYFPDLKGWVCIKSADGKKVYLSEVK